MKSTGIVRKVDELGRVVIPKEIRKTSFIQEGTPLEIYSGDDGEIIFKKYSMLKNLKNFSDEVVESLNFIVKGKIAIFDKNEIISSSGINLKNASIFYFENSFDKIHSKNGIVNVNENKILFQEIKVDGSVIGGIMVWGITNFTPEICSACLVMSIYLSRLVN
ncbi:MAG: AbrB/MazE/SpoVT family DNA-binding domain-containing protein [Clostridia bacterium]|nr:AbrB/MazE/SpoVT family DNA-binding domain-containing protein [Clostridia bacterium]